MEERDGKHPRAARGSLTNHLDAHEVLTRSDTRRNVECGPSVVLEQSVHAPVATAQTFLVDLEPLKTIWASRRRVIHFGTAERWSQLRSHSILGISAQIYDDGSLVACSDWIVRVVRALGAANQMLVLGPDLRTRRNVDDRGGNGRGESRVACKIRGLHVLNGIVRSRRTHASHQTLVLAVDRNTLEDCVCIGSSSQSCGEKS